MNSARHERCFVRSLATRQAGVELSASVEPAIALAKASGVDVVIVETSGIGQGSSGITDVSDIHVYVMTPEYGAASQLEKFDMLDFADLVIINKFDRRGAEGVRDVAKQVQRNRGRSMWPRTPCPSTARLHRSTTTWVWMPTSRLWLPLMSHAPHTHQQDSRPRVRCPRRNGASSARPSPLPRRHLGRCAQLPQLGQRSGR